MRIMVSLFGVASRVVLLSLRTLFMSGRASSIHAEVQYVTVVSRRIKRPFTKLVSETFFSWGEVLLHVLHFLFPVHTHSGPSKTNFQVKLHSK